MSVTPMFAPASRHQPIVLKRKYRHPMAYKRLRDGWQRHDLRAGGLARSAMAPGAGQGRHEDASDDNAFAFKAVR